MGIIFLQLNLLCL